MYNWLGKVDWCIHMACSGITSQAFKNRGLFQYEKITLVIRLRMLIKFWPIKMFEAVAWNNGLQHNFELSWTVLEIPTGLPVRGRQLWRRTWKFLLIFLQFYVYDLRFKAWGPTTFLAEFQTLVLDNIWVLTVSADGVLMNNSHIFIGLSRSHEWLHCPDCLMPSVI